MPKPPEIPAALGGPRHCVQVAYFFFGAAFFGATFVGAAFFGAAFVGAAFLTAFFAFGMSTLL
jgi:hypothetical protein